MSWMRWAGLAISAIAIAVHAQNVTTTAENTSAPKPLWTTSAPGAQGSASDDIPTLTSYLPSSNPTHTAVIVAPGGSYKNLALDHEGVLIAHWLNAHGIAAFVLRYRLGPKYHHPVQLEDAQRALRTVRFHAADYDLTKNHIGMWGFSAGGHLTSTAGTHFDTGDPKAADAIERESSRPDFMVLAYPVITLEPPNQHVGSAKNLLGEAPSPALVTLLSNEKQVTHQTPPTFLFATTDDPVVPVLNSVMFYEALVRNHVQAEIHIFRHGKHGIDLAQDDPDLKIWPDLLLHWLVANGWAQTSAN